MKTVTVMSVPKSGTRFLLYFFRYIVRVPVNYVHFFEKNVAEIEDALASDNIIVVPIRNDDKIRESLAGHEDDPFPVRDRYMNRLMKRGVHFVEIEKGGWSYWQINNILRDLRAPWTREVDQYVERWEPIGSKDNPNDERSQRILALKDELKYRGDA